MNLQSLIDNIGTEKGFEDIVYMENIINDGSPSWFTDIHRLKERFRPWNIHGFGIPYDLIARTKADIFLANPSDSIKNIAKNKREEVQFLLHPEEFEKWNYRCVWAIHGYPTASWRTVLIDNWEDSYYAKLHYSWILWRVWREMTRKRVEWAWHISSELDNLIKQWLLNDAFSFLPESYWIVTTWYWWQEVWMSYRESTPRWCNQKWKWIVIPFFSLFWKDKLRPQDEFLLIQILLQYNNPKDYFINRVVRTLLVAFHTILMDWWLIPENHWQNISLQIDTNCRVTSIIHKDLYEFYADLQMREAKGLGSTKFHKVLDKTINPDVYFQMKSYMFDFKLWEYVLYPMVKVFCEYFWYPEKLIIDEIIDLFESLSTEWKEIFYPYDTYYRFDNVEKTYVNWRPDFKVGWKPRFRKS